MASVPPAALGAVTDPRLSVEADAIGSKEGEVHHAGSQAPTKLFDPNVTFQEYHYYALREREYEKTVPPKANVAVGIVQVLIGKGGNKKEREQELARRTGSTSSSTPPAVGDEKAQHDAHITPSPYPGVVSDHEWHTAGRAARTATWGAIFYLITTDILGPWSVPWAFTQLGYGPGVALYTVFAVMATFSGYLLWKQFLGLDSARYPVVGYGDLAYRIYGRWMRHAVNVLQCVQFFLNVTLLIVSSSQALTQLAKGPNDTGFLCYVVAQVIFMIAGCLLGQIRTLQTFGYAASIAIYLNVFVIFMTMGITSNSEPNWRAVIASGYADEIAPIYKTAYTPPGKSFTDQINGLMQAVYSYGGATLFMNLMAEMRRPWDFWKALIAANTFIFLCYLVFGLVVYSAQGQATFNPAYQGVNPYAWQTVGNTFALITALIAAVLYGNIGIKVLYANVGREIFKFPALESRKGKMIWIVFVPVYWICAFIIAASVPQVSYLGSFVGAAMILQFSYTFPPLFALGYNILKDTLPADGAFDPATGAAAQQMNFARIWRGFRAQLLMNSFNTFYFLGAATTAIMGIYASIVGMIKFYGNSEVTAFSCNSPSG